MAWFYLLVAGIFEVIWSFFMKQSQGFSSLIPTLITIVTMIISFSLLALSMRTLPLSVAYVIWTGIGAMGAFLVGIFILGEPFSLMRLLAFALIMGGLIIMKISSH